MKKIILFLFLFPAIVFLHSGCEKGAKIEEPVIEEPIEEEEPLIEDDENGNIAVIGVSQCPYPVTPTSSGRRGFIVHIINTPDTVTTYTLPIPIAKQIIRSLIDIDTSWPDVNHFPKDKILRINVSFHFTPEEAIVKPSACTTDMGNDPKYKIYDKRQIIIEEFFPK